MDKQIFKSKAIKEELTPSSDIYGVIGVCGIVGNLVARVLLDRGFQVMGTDIKSADECEFRYTLEDYNLPIYFKDHPEAFFSSSKYIIPPPSLSKDSELFKKIEGGRLSNGKSKVLEVDDLLQRIKPDKPVICITGTNGKTTTTSLIKHICYHTGMKPVEHGFRELQGNVAYIPPLQCRLKGDVAVLETGTFGIPGDLKKILERCDPSCGIVTNITPDHMHKDGSFLSYALIKGEFVDYFKDKQLILNADDPTVMGLVESSKNSGDIITFGVDCETSQENQKKCWCGSELSINETISGMGYYNCECGLKRPQPHYLATNINRKNFTIQTPEDTLEVNLRISGLHNIYNTLGAIAVAVEFLKIPLRSIISAVESFEGVPGRLDHLGTYGNKDVIIDYAHNPGGVGTVLQELKKSYQKIAVVITVSSESGENGDIEILNQSLKIADFTIPASFYSRKAAHGLIESREIILTDASQEQFREGTLGATLKQVLEGLKKGLECDVDAVVCLGEAAFKYKDEIYKSII
jgi:UDP-N-acetylmuramate--alanine ligase